MKKISFYSVIIALAFISSCDTTGQIECIRASSNIVNKSRDLKDFKGVVFNNIGDLILTQGPEYSFSIEGPENVVELTSTRIENEILVIGTDECFNGQYDLVVRITSPEYKGISLAGVGRIESVGPIEEDIIQLELLGIGELEAEIYADTLYTSISGTGSIDYTGEVLKHEISSAGEFTLNAFPLLTKHTFVNLTGTGDCFVSAEEKLTVVISGIGSVYYKGNPDIHREIEGTGEIIDSN